MLSTSAVAAPLASPLAAAALALPDAALLDEIGSCTGLHVLVLGDRPANLMCGLIRCGCLAATSLRFGREPEAGVFDAVVVPRITPDDDLDGIVHGAWRALKPQGCFLARLADMARGGTLGLELERRLRLHGFGTLRIRPLGSSLLVRAASLGAAPAVHHA